MTGGTVFRLRKGGAPEGLGSGCGRQRLSLSDKPLQHGCRLGRLRGQQPREACGPCGSLGVTVIYLPQQPHEAQYPLNLGAALPCPDHACHVPLAIQSCQLVPCPWQPLKHKGLTECADQGASATHQHGAQVSFCAHLDRVRLVGQCREGIERAEQRQQQGRLLSCCRRQQSSPACRALQ